MKFRLMFVILHYLTIDDTRAAVESIRETCKKTSYKIVIVDNGSYNGTSTELTKVYKYATDVDLIISTNNLGFAQGNNLGIDHCIQEYEFDYIVVCNNDIMCIQDNMIDLIEDEYRKYKFDVLGPMILTMDGRYDCSPLMHLPITIEYVKKNYVKEKKLFLIEKLHLSTILNIGLKFRSFVTKKVKTVPWPAHMTNVVLHGSFLVFSKKFFVHYPGFDDRTFLYHEEELLGINIQKKKLCTLYSPKILIYHKEDSASKSMIRNSHKRNLFKLAECIKSSEVLLSALEEE